MTGIFRADLYRLLHGKGIYITTALLLLVIFITAMGDSLFPININDGDVFASLTGAAAPFWIMSAPDTLRSFLLPFIIFIAAADFTSSTVKNTLSSGKSRAKFYLSKLILSCVFSSIMVLITVILSTVFATIGSGFGGEFNLDFVIRLLKMSGAQVFMYIALTCVGVFFVFATKNAAAVIGAFLAFCFLPTVIIAVLAAGNESLSFLFSFDMAMNMSRLASMETMTTSDIAGAFALGGFYILTSTICGIILFKKSEVK
jgi:ABC-2 type transport system permease protein